MHTYKQWNSYNLHWPFYFPVSINSKSHTVDDAWDNFYYAFEHEK